MHVVRRADVAVDAHVLAVPGHVGQALELLEQGLEAELLLPLGHEVGGGGLVGIDDHVAGGAVHDDRPALILGLELIAHADDGGDAHGAGQDGGVAGAGAALGDEAEDLALVELNGLGGGQVVGGQDDGHRGVDAALGHAGQDGDDAAGHVPDVGGTGLHIGVVHAGEHLGELGGHVGDGGLGVVGAFADQLLDGLLKVQVLGHQLVGLEERGGLVAGLGTGLLSQHGQLLDGGGLGCLEARELRLGILDGIAAQGGLGALIEVKRTRGDAGGYALALDRNHRVLLSFLLDERCIRPRGCGKSGKGLPRNETAPAVALFTDCS